MPLVISSCSEDRKNLFLLRTVGRFFCLAKIEGLTEFLDKYHLMRTLLTIHSTLFIRSQVVDNFANFNMRNAILGLQVTNKQWKVNTNSQPDAMLLLLAINLHGVEVTI
ncbi:hypothetical protein C2G38_2226696 [Gigaspora rosea]|uniref:Uncharacterized protein n=1 Tax=Gigaspora rosea TaxID=44941 RepID=A0A397TZL1_9GLOM|nr:hypothetical protein C2G38_2226696 [Gigaspora rosea]